MRKCSYCGEEKEDHKICPWCYMRFCDKHLKEIDHDCQGDNYNLD